MNSVAGCSSSALMLLDELGGIVAVDDAVIEGGRQVHHLADDDLAVLHDRPFDDRVGPDDGDFGMVDHRCRHEPAQRPEAGDGDGRALQFVATWPCSRARRRRRGRLPRRSARCRAPRHGAPPARSGHWPSAWRCRYGPRHGDGPRRPRRRSGH